MGFFDKKDAAMEAAAVEAANIEEKQERQEEEAQDEAPEEATPKRKPFALWEVGGKTYKLKLRTPAIVELEQKYKNQPDEHYGIRPGWNACSFCDVGCCSCSHEGLAAWNHQE